VPSIRSATVEDWPFIEGLLRTHGLPLDGAWQHLGAFVVAEEAGAVVGTAAVEVYGDIGLLRSFAVARECRGVGLGKQLFRRVADDSRRRGLHRLFLLTTSAAPYFERFDFVQRARDTAPPPLQASAEFRGACPASATFMALDLSAAT